jgi:hypothetical protein
MNLSLGGIVSVIVIVDGATKIDNLFEKLIMLSLYPGYQSPPGAKAEESFIPT